VSLINQMLRDLDRRQAAPPSSASDVVRPVGAPPAGREWFWRTISLLVLGAAGWVAWVAYQLQPHFVATKAAYEAADAAKQRPQRVNAIAMSAPLAANASAPAVAPPPPPGTPAPAGQSAPTERTQEPPRAAPRAPDLFKLAQSIETPITAPANPAGERNHSAAKPEPTAQKARPLVLKRDRPVAGADGAEASFRRAVMLMNDGRVSEAQALFAEALQADPKHVASRQALVALLLDRKEFDAAQRLLEEGLAAQPENAQFATVLGRILVERGDLQRAAAVLSSTPDGAKYADHQMMLGAVLQRLGRDAEAVPVFQNATKLGAPPAPSLVALAISYEHLGKKREALHAYQQSLASQAPDEVRAYAETRIRALR
jgi:MSHA biogenesis protein MshN